MTSAPPTQSFQVLVAQWYNALVKNCGLDPNTFQLVQGNEPLGSTTEQMWNILDAVPPVSINHFFNPSQFNSFSADYGAVVNNLIPQGSDQFESCMGDYYSLWDSYMKTRPPIPAGGVAELFRDWAAKNMPADQATNCYNILEQSINNPVSVAVGMWYKMVSAAAPYGGVRAYDGTVSQLRTALASSKGVQFTMDTDSESSDVSHTWAGGVVSSPPGLTALAASAPSGSGATYEVTFDHIVTFAARPLAEPSNDPILGLYTPWYCSGALKLAYQTRDNTVWRPGTHPTWDDAFGSNGNMLYATTGLVVVDGITVTMTANASGGGTYSPLQLLNILEPTLIEPMLPFVGSHILSHAAPSAENGVTISDISPGNPIILGAVVRPIGQVFS